MQDEFFEAGGNGKNGRVSVAAADGAQLIGLNASDKEATISVGRRGRPGLLAVQGSLIVYGIESPQMVNLSAERGLQMQDGQSPPTVDLVKTGLALNDEKGVETAFLSNNGSLTIGGEGRVRVYSAQETALIEMLRQGQQTVNLSSEGNLTLGGNGVNGVISVDTAYGTPSVELRGDNAHIAVGSRDLPGNVSILNAGLRELIGLNGEKGAISSIIMSLRDVNGEESITLDGYSGSGIISLLSADKADKYESILLDGKTGDIRSRSISIRNAKEQDSILLDGESGDIWITNADCAEDFEVSSREGVEPGDVMGVNDAGHLELVTHPYDTRVAGVVSGAGDLKPGLVLGRQTGCANRVPIALLGKVLCKVDADYESIEVGNLLTTSETPGHAMKASDPAKAFGATIGKALEPLLSGQGLISILVALQ